MGLSPSWRAIILAFSQRFDMHSSSSHLYKSKRLILWGSTQALKHRVWSFGLRDMTCSLQSYLYGILLYMCVVWANLWCIIFMVMVCTNACVFLKSFKVESPLLVVASAGMNQAQVGLLTFMRQTLGWGTTFKFQIGILFGCWAFTYENWWWVLVVLMSMIGRFQVELLRRYLLLLLLC